jgi:protein gp37
MTKIEWTEKTWNPVIGCSRVSEGCRNCYAERMAVRLASNPATPEYADVAKSTPTGPRWTGKVKLIEARLEKPLTWKKPRLVFVNSMSDLFHESLSFRDILRVFRVMMDARQHTFQVLTKRPRVAVEFFRWWERQEDCNWAYQKFGELYPNIWLGVSVENQEQADKRIPMLLRLPVAVRFLSCEPLLGPLGLRPNDDFSDNGHGRGWLATYDGSTVDWVIVGGESGANARPMDSEWALAIRDQCQAAGVPFFFKQWGEYWADDQGQWLGAPMIDEQYAPQEFWKIGKRAAGRLLNGREWNEFPGGVK